MPAARHRSRSPFRAWAVMAMIGKRAFLRVVQLADGCRSLKAVHFRHLHVHQHHVEILLLKQSQGLPAILGDLDAVAAISQNMTDELLVGRRVFGHQHAKDSAGDRQDPRGLAGVDQGNRAFGSDRLGNRVEQGRPRDRLFQAGRRQFPALIGVILPIRGREHEDHRSGQPRVLLKPADQREAVDAGHDGIGQHHPIGPAGRRRLVNLRQAAWARPGPRPPASTNWPAFAGGFSGWWRSRRSPAPAGRGRCPGRRQSLRLRRPPARQSAA